MRGGVVRGSATVGGSSVITDCISYDGCGRNATYWCPHTLDTDERVYYPHNWPRVTDEAMTDFFRILQFQVVGS